MPRPPDRGRPRSADNPIEPDLRSAVAVEALDSLADEIPLRPCRKCNVPCMAAPNGERLCEYCDYLLSTVSGGLW